MSYDVVALLIFFVVVRNLLFVVLPLVEVLFHKIIFVFCSGLCKEFIVKELRPGTQYKFRFVKLSSLHVSQDSKSWGMCLQIPYLFTFKQCKTKKKFLFQGIVC